MQSVKRDSKRQPTPCSCEQQQGPRCKIEIEDEVEFAIKIGFKIVREEERERKREGEWKGSGSDQVALANSCTHAQLPSRPPSATLLSWHVLPPLRTAKWNSPSGSSLLPRFQPASPHNPTSRQHLVLFPSFPRQTLSFLCLGSLA